MRKFYLSLCALLMVFMASAQLTGTKTIPGDYATIAAAVNDLNTQGVGAGGVIFNVTAGHTESSADSIILTATGTAANPIVFQKSGAGNNPVVNRTGTGLLVTTTLGASGDAVIIIEGSDYVTFDGIDVAAGDPGIEYGYYSRKASATDGVKNLTIKNANVTMNKGTNDNIAGIYISNGFRGQSISSATGVTVTAAGGINENVILTGNTISNVHAGILLRGSSATGFRDQNVVVGQSGAGNTIQNFGGGAASTTYGVYLIYQENPTISYNTINNTAGGGTPHTSTLYGIFFSTGVAGTISANNNNINLENSSTSGTQWIYNGNTSTVSISNNTFSGTIGATSTSYLIYNNNSYTTTATITNNQTSGTIAKTGSSGTFYGYYNNGSPTGILNFSGNNISNITLEGTSTFIAVNSTTTGANTQNIYNNIISNITGSNTGTITGINVTLANTRNIYGNTIFNLSGSGSVVGINNGSGGATALNIYKNKIYDLSSSSTGTTAGLVTGILVSSGSTGTNAKIYNNLVGNLTAPGAAGTDAIRGIGVTSTTSSSTVTLAFNTIYLNASSTGTNFGTSGVYSTASATATTANLVMNNNIIVNTSTAAGTGYTVAFRRSGVSLSNYDNSSNHNLFYAGTPGTSNLIFYDGTNADQVISAYKARVAPRDANSFTENPPFLSTTGSSPLFLHINTTIATSIESGGAPVTGITDDFDGDTRNVTTPDVGADEFTGTPLPICSGTPVPGSITGPSGVCEGFAGTLVLSGGPTDLGITYQWKVASTPGGPYTDIPGATNPSLNTGVISSTQYYVVTVTCSNSGLSATTAEFSVSINASPTVTVTPASPAVCQGQSVDLTASGATTYTWSPSTNLSATSGSMVTSTPTAPRNYTVIGTDANGCKDTTTVSVTLNPAVTSTAVASNTNVCANGSTQLSATGNSANYIATAIAHNPIATPGTGVTVLAENGTAVTAFTSGDLDDGRWNSIAIPFTFNYYGNDYSAINITTNGYASFGSLTTTQGFNVTLPNTSTPNNAIHLVTSDLDLRAPVSGTTTASVFYFTEGVAPNRKFVINFKDVRFYHVDSTSGPQYNPGTATIQAILYEGTNVIEIHTTEISNTTVNKLQGLESTTGLFATVVPGRNNTAVWTGAPDAYRFTQPVYNYSWSPSTFLSSTTIANPVAANMTATTTYSVAVTDNSTGCSDTSSVTITVGSALTTSLSASATIVCESDSVQLTALPAGGGAPYTYSWSNGTSVVSTDSTFYVHPVGSTTYTLTVTDNCGQTANSSVLINEVSPAVTATTPASRCGVGTVTLGASASAGANLQWFESTTSNLAIGTGTSFTTPVLSSTTTYYVSASQTTSGVESAGKSAPTGTTNTTGNNWGLVFDVVNNPITINSVDIYSVGSTAGSMSVNLTDNSGNILATAGPFAYGPGTTSNPTIVTLPVNFTVNPGTGYRLVSASMSGGAVIRETSGNSYPYTSPSGNVVVTSGFITNPGSSTYYWFYNWQVTVGCISPRIPVTATVTTPPAVTVAATNNVICAGNTTTITASSANTGYNYTWAPSTGLNTTTGAVVQATPDVTTTYIVTADDGTCVDTIQITIDVNPSPVNAEATVSSNDVCEGASVNFNSSALLLDQYLLNSNCSTGFIDISTTGTDVPGTIADDSEHSITIPSFSFNGIAYTQALVGVNGLIVLGSTSGQVNAGNATLPSTANSSGNIFLAPFWDDLDIQTGLTIKTQTVGNIFIIQYTNAAHNSFTTGGITFQVQLDLSTGVITYVYQDAEFGNATYDFGANATIGLQVTSTTALQYSYNTASLTSGQCISFTPTPVTYSWTGPNGFTSLLKNPVRSNLTPADAGTYTVTFTSSINGCTSTDTVNLNVKAATAITTQPAATAVCEGAAANFSVTATGAGTLTYQWKKDGVDITGATSASYNIAAVAAADAGSYTVVVTGECGSVTSSAALLTVNATTAITTQPSAVSTCVGSAASFTVAATGSGLTYQWKKDGVDIAGATTSTYNIASVAAGDAGSYTVVVTGACGSVTSSAALLTLGGSTTITTQPSSVAVCDGDAASFTVVATGSGLTYQWKKDGTDIPGATSVTYDIAGVVSIDAGTYTVVVTGACGSVTSAGAVLSINAETMINTQPTAQTVCAGSAASFTVAATGTAITYQWQKNGTDITGATSATYSIASATAADAGNYTVIVVGTCNAVTSTTVSLTVNPATTITTQPTSITVCNQQSATFTVVAAGTGTLTYQWKKDGVDITGATSASYNIPSIASSHAGSYTVVVTGGCGSVTSSAAVLTWDPCTSVPVIDADITSVILMPNMVKHNTTIRVQAKKTMKVNWSVVDAKGRVVMNFSNQVFAGQNDLQLEVSRLAAGLYHVIGVTEKGNTEVLKFVKE